MLHFQSDVLCFACSGPSLPLNQDQLQKVLGAENGAWLWGKLHKQDGSPNDLHNHLVTLIEYVDEHPGTGLRISEAFAHDIAYDQHLDDPFFRFSYTLDLNGDSRSAVRPLMVDFYDVLLESGFPEHVHGQTNKLDRNGFAKAFWQANERLTVCPACDDARPTRIEDKVFTDTDHFLPKSKYPFLSVHPNNLLPMCKGCNESFKLERDPIDQPDQAPLVNSFHPYASQPAVQCTVVRVNRPIAGVRKVAITEKDGTVSRRVASLNRVFRLEKRWEDTLSREIVVSLRDALAGEGYRRRERGEWPDKTELTAVLDDTLNRRTNRTGQLANSLVTCGYLRFALADDDEFEELLAQYRGE